MHRKAENSGTSMPSKASFINCARGFPADGGEFEFFSPPDAPVFRPSEEEFARGPIEYVASIRPIAEPFGICRIVPPPSFKPPFAVDINKFAFTPRVQRLNEIEAMTRIKLNFLEQLIKFWDLQGATLKIPLLEKKALDLHNFHTIVHEEGGFETCTREKKWSRVAAKLGYSTSRQNKGPIASLLRQHYERLLFPYDVFLSGATIAPDSPAAPAVHPSTTTAASVDIKLESSDSLPACENQPPAEPAIISDELPENKLADPSITVDASADVKANVRKREENESENGLPEKKQLRSSPRRTCRRMQSVPVSSPTRRSMMTKNALNTIANLRSSKELKKLQVYGAGPKMPGVAASSNDLTITPPQTRSSSCLASRNGMPFHLSSTNPPASSTATSTHEAANEAVANEETKACIQCGEDDPSQPHLFIHCVDCSSRYHLHCLIPPLSENFRPKGSWHCPRCIAYLVQSHPQAFTHEFGFGQSMRKYSLAEFAETADNFKQDYFRMKPTTVPFNVVEREFWRILSSLEESVTVEYGADLHTNEYGSGFATSAAKNRFKDDLHYVNHPWNLNNLPVLDGSVFKHINTNISGMIVPWMYVGMCFSTFCWHNEDHWSYSINYLHWGEAKSWYGVPGEHADTFERAMKRIVPDLFESQPDLLHQLVTQTNPNILMAEGVPIYKVHQNSGDFVITFPRSYHAGFNQGMNFAEAVNFAPADWLPIGRVCITHYSMLHRYPVFSHDELICKMATQSEELTPEIALATYHDMIRMVTVEKELRLDALSFGISKAEVEKFENFPDDERQCVHCKTTCFLSAITCPCSLSRLVCIPHRDRLCSSCPPGQHVLKYRFSLDELPLMLQKLKIKSDAYQEHMLAIQAQASEEAAAADDTEEEEYEDEDFSIEAHEIATHVNDSNEDNVPESQLQQLLQTA